MPLTKTQLDILKEIKKGVGATMQIAENLNMPRSRINYLMQELKNETYLIGSEGFPPGGVGKKEFLNARLTDKGETALESPKDIIQGAPQTVNSIALTVDSINAPLSFIQDTGDESNVQINQTSSISTEITEILGKIEKLEESVARFPESQREEALVHLENLKAEIQSPDQRQPKRIRTYFNSFLRIALPLANLLVNGADFLNNVTDLSSKFNVEISPEQIEMIEASFDPLVNPFKNG